MATKARRATSSKKTATRKRTTHSTHGAKSRAAKAGGAKSAHTKKTSRKWSKHVTEHSDALDLKKGVFKLKDPKKIASSLKASAEHSRRRKSGPYRSALSMLIFYMNRGGKNLLASRKRILQRAKRELRHQFGRA